MATAIPCFVAGNKGYVWDADGAMSLRKEHRIMGCLVGSVAQFKNQNEVKHLPLELSADEVTLAVREGWIQIFPETSAPVRAAAAAAAAATAAAAAAAQGSGGGGGDHDARSNGYGRRDYTADPDWEDAYHEYYSQFDPRVGFTGRFLPLLGAKRRRLAPQAPQEGHPQPRGEGVHGEAKPDLSGTTDVSPNGNVDIAATASALASSPIQVGVESALAAAGVAAGPDCSEAGWRAAVAEGGSYTLPLTAAAAAAARAGAAAAPPSVPQVEGEVVEAAEAAADGGISSVGWTYPATDYERLRFAVFCDLHRQGFVMTGGIKFGADMLAYPGDPSLYHAQFTVRPQLPGVAMNPMLLKAVARGSHAARKHVLLAFYADAAQAQQERPQMRYMSLAPEAGFGSKA